MFRGCTGASPENAVLGSFNRTNSLQIEYHLHKLLHLVDYPPQGKKHKIEGLHALSLYSLDQFHISSNEQ